MDSRYHAQWPVISRTVRELFQQRCARCGREGGDGSSGREVLQVHHIDEDPGNNALENLIPLCAPCHLQIEKEARRHAPLAGTQLELFEESSYLKQMQQMREAALEDEGRTSSSVWQMDEEEYEDYLRECEDQQ